MTLQADVRLTRGLLHLDVTLGAQPGQVVAVLGPNGSGKTTLLHTLAGLIRLQQGQIHVAGSLWDCPKENVWEAPEQRRTGLVLADHLLFPHLSVIENVGFGPRSRGVAKANARARARTELEAIGLGDRLEVRPRELSTGQGPEGRTRQGTDDRPRPLAARRTAVSTRPNHPGTDPGLSRPPAARV